MNSVQKHEFILFIIKLDALNTCISVQSHLGKYLILVFDLRRTTFNLPSLMDDSEVSLTPQLVPKT